MFDRILQTPVSEIGYIVSGMLAQRQIDTDIEETVGRGQHRPAVNPAELIAPPQDIGGRSMYDDFSGWKESNAHIQAVVGLHLVIHQSWQLGVVPRAPAAETVGQAQNTAQARKAPLDNNRGVMARGILGRSQLRITPRLFFTRL